jgi:hypothetical protein
VGEAETGGQCELGKVYSITAGLEENEAKEVMTKGTQVEGGIHGLNSWVLSFADSITYLHSVSGYFSHPLTRGLTAWCQDDIAWQAGYNDSGKRQWHKLKGQHESWAGSKPP